MSLRWRWPGSLGLLLLAWASLAGARAEPVSVDAHALYFNPDDPSQRRAGALEWIAGVALSVPDPRFGGWSGMVLSSDGRRLTAVSDVGFWLTATLAHDQQGRITGLTDAQLGPLLGPEGQPLKSKRLADAEALARDRDGSLIVGFEGTHRLWRYRPGPGAEEGLLAARPEPVAPPPQLSRVPRNGGVEAMTVLADGRLLMVTEDLTNAAGDLVGWLRDAKGWHDLSLAPAGLFKPTDLAQLPGGDVLVLERRFTLIGGVAMRLRRVPLKAIRPGARLEGAALVELAPPVSVDNMEALAAVKAADGSTLLYVLSDDNFNPVQRTLLLQFRLIE